MGDALTDIRLLGPVTVLCGGRSVDLGGSQRRAVIARLALSCGEAVATSTLVDSLWDDPPPTARKVVQVHVSRLRAALPADVVQTTGGGYRLGVDPEVVDVHRFERLVRQGRAAVADDDAASAVDHIRAAEALWRGPALADVGLVPFATPAVVRLEEARAEAVEVRLRADVARGEHAAAVAELEALVREHPLREGLWALLMTALHRSGRQADALRAYERARTELAEVGLAPGAPLRACEEVILANESAPTVPSGSVEVAPRDRTVRVASRPLLVGPELVVGRDAQAGALRAALDTTAAGDGPGLVALRGEEGFGKSSLLATFTAAVADRATVLVGRCRQHIPLPFAPWVEVLGQLGAGDVLAQVESTSDLESAEARRVLLFATTVECLRKAADRGAVVVVLDDLHWADDGTISLLLHVLGEVAGAPILVVGAWRPGDVAIGRPAVHLVDHVTRSGRPTIDLGALSVEDIAAMVAGHAPEVAPDDRAEAAARLLEVTSGVPLFVADAVGATTASGTGLALDLSRPRVPETARSIVARRLTEAGAHVVPVAEAVAVLGEAGSLDLVADLAETTPADVLGAWDDLARVGLLRDGEDGPQFTHAAFRAAVVESTPRGRLHLLHAAAFARLAGRHVAAATLALHADGAGRLLESDVASRALVAAGAEAAGRGAFADAVRWYERAAETAPATRRAEVQVALADALWRAGDIASAKTAAAQIVRGAVDGRHPAEPSVLVDAALLHSTVGAGYGPDAESIELLDTVLSRTSDPLLRARVEVGVAYHHAAWGSAASVARRALAAARAVLPTPAPRDLEAHLRFAEGLALLDSPDVTARVDHAQRLLALGRDGGGPRVVGRALRLRGMAELSAGAFVALDRTIDDLDLVARETGSWMYESDVWRWRAATALAGGDHDGVRRTIEELERLAASPLAGWVFVGTQKVLLVRAEGDLDLALTMVEGLRAAMPAATAWQTDRMLADLYRLDLLHAMDRQDEATAELVERAPWAELHLSSCRRYPAEVAMLGLAVARAGLTGPAPDLARRVAPFAGQQVVLGWGEGIIGTFDACIAALATVIDGG